MLRSDPIASPFSDPAAVPDLAAAARSDDRTALAERIAGYQKALGAPLAAVNAAERLERRDSAVIVTGQQPGLLGGPLLSLAKALSAVAWARALEAESGTPVVPVFWAASEDHDLDEVNRCVVLDRGDHPVTFKLPLEPDGLMLSEVDPAAGADELLLDVQAALPASEFLPEVMGVLRAARAPSIGRWFTGILTRWLGEEGLVVVEPRLFRSAASRVLSLEHEKPGRIAAALGDGPLDPAAVPFFNVVDGRRKRPSKTDELSADPEAISWDVVTRVLAQNLALPVAGHIVGPSELAYCRQIEPAHRLLGIPAPPLIPRASLCLVEKKVEKALARFEVGIDEVLARGEEALIEDVAPADFERSLTGLEEAIAAALPDVRDAAGRVDEVLTRKTEGAEKDVLKAIDRLRDHGRKAFERVTGTDAERRRKLLAHLLPTGAPQERVLSPLPFLARHGPELLGKLLQVVAEDPSGARAVYLSGRKS